jgi:hypothetical protein
MNNNFFTAYFNLREKKKQNELLAYVFAAVDDQTKINIIEILKLGNKRIRNVYAMMK